MTAAPIPQPTVAPEPPKRRDLPKWVAAGNIPIAVMTLDNTKPSAVPGALSTTLRSNFRSNRCTYEIVFVPQARVFRVSCLHSNGDEDIVYVPEHIVIQWTPKEEFREKKGS